MRETGLTAGAEGYASLWESDAFPHRWVIWDTPEETLVFDRKINCPVDIVDERVLREVLDRMRRADVPETREYPGGPCA
ncbi:hypothetical protein ACQB60_38955 [Actinomycetota bacterium Odt1-20B]